MGRPTGKPDIDFIDSCFGAPTGERKAEREAHYYQAISRLDRDEREAARGRDQRTRRAKYIRDASALAGLGACEGYAVIGADESAAMLAKAEKGREFAERRKEKSKRVTARARDGFISDNDILLKLFIRRVPRAPQYSEDGMNFRTAHDRSRKVDALDAEYVGINESMRGWIRIALTADFEDIEALREALKTCGVPEPTFAVSDPAEGSVIRRPHLIYLLAKAVNFGPNGYSDPIAAYCGIERALTYRLLAAAADIKGLDTTETKNPVSPYMLAHVLTDELFSLTQLGEGLDSRVTNAMLTEGFGHDPAFERKLDALARTGGDVAYWNGMMTFACREVKAHWTADKRNADAFLASMAAFGLEFGVRCRVTRCQIENVVRKISTWIWANHDPSLIPAHKPSGQGPCKEMTKGSKTVREAQSIGGRFSSEKQREKTSACILSARDALISEGIVTPTNGQIAERAGVNKRTVERFNQSRRTRP